MTDLIPRKSWTLAFEEMEDVVFHLKEVTDQEYLELMDILEPLYKDGSTRKEVETAKLKCVDYMLIKVENLEEVSFKIKLNLAIHIIRYSDPDVLSIKK